MQNGIPLTAASHKKRREKYKIMKKNNFLFCPKYTTSRTAVQKK
jgi:hypothetical protein